MWLSAVVDDLTGGLSGMSVADPKLSSGGGLGGKSDVSNFSNSAASVSGVNPAAGRAMGVLGRFRSPVLSEMLSGVGTLIRREILTLGALKDQMDRTALLG